MSHKIFRANLITSEENFVANNPEYFGMTNSKSKINT
jgi:hypothetical protein